MEAKIKHQYPLSKFCEAYGGREKLLNDLGLKPDSTNAIIAKKFVEIATKSKQTDSKIIKLRNQDLIYNTFRAEMLLDYALKNGIVSREGKEVLKKIAVENYYAVQDILLLDKKIFIKDKANRNYSKEKLKAHYLFVVKGYTQRQIAKIVGVSEKSIMQWKKRYKWSLDKENNDLRKMGNATDIFNKFIVYLKDQKKNNLYKSALSNWNSFIKSLEEKAGFIESD